MLIKGGAMGLHLQLRLKNCLQTILDVESDVSKYPLYSAFKPEMETLKKYLIDVDNLELSEDEVLRLENATTQFLSELYLPMSEGAENNNKQRVLQ